MVAVPEMLNGITAASPEAGVSVMPIETAPADSSTVWVVIENSTTGSGSSSVIDRVWVDGVPRVAFEGPERVNATVSVPSCVVSARRVTDAVAVTCPAGKVSVVVAKV